MHYLSPQIKSDSRKFNRAPKYLRDSEYLRALLTSLIVTDQELFGDSNNTLYREKALLKLKLKVEVHRWEKRKRR